MSIRSQIDKNLLAVISLAIAISALSYTSWRNEKSEENRNLRAAGFEIMREAARLQYFTDATTFGAITPENQAIKGWASVNLILSLSQLMAEPVQNNADILKSSWQQHWSQLE